MVPLFFSASLFSRRTSASWQYYAQDDATSYYGVCCDLPLMLSALRQPKFVIHRNRCVGRRCSCVTILWSISTIPGVRKEKAKTYSAEGSVHASRDGRVVIGLLADLLGWQE